MLFRTALRPRPRYSRKHSTIKLSRGPQQTQQRAYSQRSSGKDDGPAPATLRASLTWKNLAPLFLLSVYTSVVLNTSYLRQRVKHEEAALEEQKAALESILARGGLRGDPDVERELLRANVTSGSTQDEYEVVPAAGSWNVAQGVRQSALTASTQLSDIFFSSRRFREETEDLKKTGEAQWEDFVAQVVKEGEEEAARKPKTRHVANVAGLVTSTTDAPTKGKEVYL